jgi:hypothetical protein
MTIETASFPCDIRKYKFLLATTSNLGPHEVGQEGVAIGCRDFKPSNLPMSSYKRQLEDHRM